uniref:Uncharacterized protein n=2 Tax=Ovis aries TaxID=9940 RepID=A0AC11EBG2_SHEEP
MCRPRFGVQALPCCGKAPSPARGGRGSPPSAPTFPGEPDRAQQGPGASLPRQGRQLPFPDPDVLALLWSKGGLYVASEGQPPCPGGLGVRRAGTGRGGSPAMVRGPSKAAEPSRHHEPRGPSLPWCRLEGGPAEGLTGLHSVLQATPRRRLFHPETRAMWGSQELLPLWFLVLAVGSAEHVYRPGRRVCVVGAPQGPMSESFVQRVYQPFLTTCDGYRACSTYRTLYRTAYRRHPGPAPSRPRYACCPGWKRTGGVPGACGAAICQPPCQNGGSCVQPGRCHCPAGWQGDACQTDVDECSAGGGGCPQHCVNTAGSYWCQCWEGHRPSVDGAVCLPERGTPRVTPDPETGADSEVKEEVQRLQSRVDVLEEVRPGQGSPGSVGLSLGVGLHGGVLAERLLGCPWSGHRAQQAMSGTPGRDGAETPPRARTSVQSMPCLCPYRDSALRPSHKVLDLRPPQKPISPPPALLTRGPGLGQAGPCDHLRPPASGGSQRSSPLWWTLQGPAAGPGSAGWQCLACWPPYCP